MAKDYVKTRHLPMDAGDRVDKKISITAYNYNKVYIMITQSLLQKMHITASSARADINVHHCPLSSLIALPIITAGLEIVITDD